VNRYSESQTTDDVPYSEYRIRRSEFRSIGICIVDELAWWCGGETVAKQWRNSGETVAKQWRNSGETWRNSGETVAKRGETWRNSGETVAKQFTLVVVVV
jgi:hypothetical protein